MTVEERMEIIRNKAKKDRDETQAIEDARMMRIHDLSEQIRSASQRIKDLCKLANTCVENGIEIPKSSWSSHNYDAGKKWGYPHEFIADGIRHHVGFFERKAPFTYIGIRNGGACGVWDFRTNGEFVQSISNTDYDRGKITEPQIRDMEQFIKEFPEFEAAFLKWIDSLA